MRLDAKSLDEILSRILNKMQRCTEECHARSRGVCSRDQDQLDVATSVNLIHHTGGKRRKIGITSTEADKAFDKIQPTRVIKRKTAPPCARSRDAARRRALTKPPPRRAGPAGGSRTAVPRDREGGQGLSVQLPPQPARGSPPRAESGGRRSEAAGAGQKGAERLLFSGDAIFYMETPQESTPLPPHTESPASHSASIAVTDSRSPGDGQLRFYPLATRVGDLNSEFTAPFTVLKTKYLGGSQPNRVHGCVLGSAGRW